MQPVRRYLQTRTPGCSVRPNARHYDQEKRIVSSTILPLVGATLMFMERVGENSCRFS